NQTIIVTLGMQRFFAYGFSITNREPDEWITGNSSYRTMSGRLCTMMEALCASSQSGTKKADLIGRCLASTQTDRSSRSSFPEQACQSYSNRPKRSLPTGNRSTQRRPKLQFQYFRTATSTPNASFSPNQ